ncbi:MAG TPA: hypothetical protein PKD55_00200 [Bellilinea sp.]|nr:hypothetical protein [Bellilinea sp.]
MLDITQWVQAGDVDTNALREEIEAALGRHAQVHVSRFPAFEVRAGVAEGELSAEEAEIIQVIAAAHDPLAAEAERQLQEDQDKAVKQAALDVIQVRAAEDPAFAALVTLLGIDTNRGQ